MTGQATFSENFMVSDYIGNIRGGGGAGILAGERVDFNYNYNLCGY